MIAASNIGSLSIFRDRSYFRPLRMTHYYGGPPERALADQCGRIFLDLEAFPNGL